jgi:hypothetical protein
MNESTSKELVNRLANSLKTHINELNNILQSWSDFSVSSDLPSMLESLNLNSDGHNVCENIVNSYVFACREIQSVLKSKIKNVEYCIVRYEMCHSKRDTCCIVIG